LLPQAPLNATPTNSSFVYRGKNAKEMKKIIANLKTNAEKSANESLSSFKDYSLQGITLEEQEQYLQSCVNKSNLTKSSENDRLYDAPCLGKATEEQKRLLADFCEELDQIIGGKCNSRNYFYFFILAKFLISKFTTWIVAFLYYFKIILTYIIFFLDGSYIPKSFCVLGGPGSGKTFLVDCLIEQCMARQVGVMSSAYAASACLHLCSCLRNGKRIVSNTLHHTLSLSVAQTSQTLQELCAMSEVTVNKLRSGPFDGVNVFIVDEISMVSESFVSHIADRLRQISLSNKSSTFGKFLFVACGDFLQLPPPKAPSIYESVVQKYIFQEG